MNVFLTRGFRCVMSLLALGFAVSLLMLAAVFPSRADSVCPDGRLTLQAVIAKAVEIETACAAGKMWNALDRAPGGGAVLYVVFEKMQAGAVFVFQDDCLVMFSENLSGDKLLEIGRKTSRVNAFGGKGI